MKKVDIAKTWMVSVLLLLCVCLRGQAKPAQKVNGKNPLEFVPNSDIKEALPLDKLKPADHMDAVKMEQDGRMNKEYHKELFLGNHEDMEKEGNAEQNLKDIFYRIDGDRDEKLSESELEAWILQKMEEHFDESQRENEEIFKHLDPDGDGKVHWKEYYTHFLLAKGYDVEKAKKHVLDYDEIELTTEERDELIRYKFRWTDADQDPVDNMLSKQEFLTFRHPEEGNRSLSNMVSAIMKSMDTNYDDVIIESEFVAMPPGEVEGEEFQEMDLRWQDDRKREFREVMDKDHNGKVTVDELKEYLNPKNPLQALVEARNLLQLIDDNQDKHLSLDEILKHREIFISSKAMNFAANVHDEF